MLRLALELESPRRRGVERPLEQLLRYHDGVDELIRKERRQWAVFMSAGVGAKGDVMESSCATPFQSSYAPWGMEHRGGDCQHQSCTMRRHLVALLLTSHTTGREEGRRGVGEEEIIRMAVS